MLCYLSHPLGCENGNETVTRQDNIYNAGLWFTWLTGAGYQVVCPWYASIAWLPNNLRPSGFATQLEVIKVCELIFFCGQWNPHMKYEKTAADRAKLQQADLTDLGRLPPYLEKKEARELIEARIVIPG